MTVKICFKMSDIEIKQGYVNYMDNCIVDKDIYQQLNTQRFVEFLSSDKKAYIYNVDMIDCIIIGEQK